jgi:hypothetical protein
MGREQGPPLNFRQYEEGTGYLKNAKAPQAPPCLIRHSGACGRSNEAEGEEIAGADSSKQSGDSDEPELASMGCERPRRAGRAVIASDDGTASSENSSSKRSSGDVRDILDSIQNENDVLSSSQQSEEAVRRRVSRNGAVTRKYSILYM